MLASVIREIVGPAIRECPPECGIVAITRIEVSDDLSYATAYISALQHAQAAVEYLTDKRGELQKRIGKAISVRRVPQLRFRLDKDELKASRIDQLLEEVSKHNPEDGSADAQ
jgi:ribosome-binding factor A